MSSVHKIEDRLGQHQHQYITRQQPYRLSSRIMTLFVFICNVVVFVSMGVCLFDAHWITSDGFRQGLLYLCIEEPDPDSKFKNQPLPFDLSRDELDYACYPNRDVGYLRVCTILCLLTILSALASASIAALNMRVHIVKRLRFIRLATCTVLVSLICNIALLIIYPTEFKKELDQSNRDVWQLNYAYGLSAGSAAISLFSSFISIFLIARTSDLYEYNAARSHL